MSRAQVLHHLQGLDLERDEKSRRLGEVKARLGESEALLTARRARDAEQEGLNRLALKLRDLELEAEGLEARIASAEGKLYGDQIKNPKELVGLEQDVRYLRRKLDGLEDEMLLLMTEMDEVQESLAARKREVAEIEAAWSQEQAALRQEQAALEADLVSLKEKREAVVKSVAEGDLALYDALRSKKGGRAVALLQGGICQGCGVTLPTSKAQQVRTGEELVPCVNCGRILWAER